MRRPESSIAGKYEASTHFAEQFAPVAAKYGAAFLDAAQYAAPFSTEGFAAKVEACYMKAIEAHRRG